MKFALVDDQLQEAQPNLKGSCPYCGSSVIAKCGEIKIKHWSHSKVRNCDPWWENETEWHRAWKGLFPKEWQEFIQRAENGEKHIADVMTDQGYVIEFQHSPIKSEERQSREDFYKKMIWIIDGSRRKKDKDKFVDDLDFVNRIDGRDDLCEKPGGFRCLLLDDWGGRNVPVLFDFGEAQLWGLLPKKLTGDKEYMFRVERAALVASLSSVSTESNDNFDRLLRNYTGKIEAHHLRLKLKAEQAQRQNPFGFLPQITNHSCRRRF